MKILLDTQALIWFQEDDSRLSEGARLALEDASNVLLVSIASFWEMSIKIGVGKLKIDSSLEDFLTDTEEVGIFILTITTEHILENLRLPFHHRDPFDRIIASQCKSEQLSLVSADKSFDFYIKNRIW